MESSEVDTTYLKFSKKNYSLVFLVEGLGQKLIKIGAFFQLWWPRREIGLTSWRSV